MKIFAFTFSIYIFLLSVKSCGDACECIESQKICISENAGHDQDKHDNDACSPFCICACCSSHYFVQLPHYSHTMKLNVKAYIEFSSYVSIFFGTFLSAIWHPPKY